MEPSPRDRTREQVRRPVQLYLLGRGVLYGNPRGVGCHHLEGVMNTTMQEAWDNLESAMWKLSKAIDNLEPKDKGAVEIVINAQAKVRGLWLQMNSLSDEIGEIIG